MTPALSPSRAADFKQCPLLFRFRTIDKLEGPPSPAAARGTLVHAVLEHLFDLPAAERTPAAAVALLGPRWAALVEERPELEAMIADDELLTQEGWFAAAQTLGGLGYQNVSVKTFDGTYGYPAAAPFDRILITAGTAEIPETLLAQLAVGGRLVAPVGTPERQRIRVVSRRKTDFAREDGEEVVFVPLIGRFGRAPA